jgi:glycerol kinase
MFLKVLKYKPIFLNLKSNLNFSTRGRITSAPCFKIQTMFRGFHKHHKIENDDKYILAIDQGTTSSRIALINHELKIVKIKQNNHTQIKLHPGWTEHDPVEIMGNINELIKQMFIRDQSLIQRVKAVSITNQRETCLAWNRITGKPLTNAIVWHDTRNMELVERTMQTNKIGKDHFREKTGLPINTYFSAWKIKWLLENQLKPEDLENCCFGTIDSWIIYNLTGNYFTDVTNASRTMLMNLKTLEWDEELLRFFNIPQKSLPKILSCSDNYGIIQKGELKSIPITGVIGDQQSACLGHVLSEGEVKNTYGTGSFVLMNTGKKIVHSKHGLLTTVLYQSNNNNNKYTVYALEGAIETAGSALNWLRDNLKLFNTFKELENLYDSVEGSKGIVFVPAFSGLFSPYWDSKAKGLLVGLTHYTEIGHIIRAAFEAISLRTFEIVESFEIDSGIKVKKLMVDGGVTSSNQFLQTQSNVLGSDRRVQRKSEKEVTILGSAIAAGMEESIQFWKNIEEVKSHLHVEKEFKNEWSNDYRQGIINQWKEAVSKSLSK